MNNNFELDDESIIQLIKDSKIFYKDVDINFFTGLNNLIKRTTEEIKKRNLFKEYDKFDYSETEEVGSIGRFIR